MLLRLPLHNLLGRKIRTALTVAAIAMSVALVVSVTSGYASFEAAAHKLLSSFLVSTDAQITRSNETHGGVPESIIDLVRGDPDVATAVGRVEFFTSLLDLTGKPIAARLAQINGIARPADRRIESMELMAGRWFDGSREDEAVIDQVAAMLIKDPTNVAADDGRASLGISDSFELAAPDGNRRFVVTGIVRKPKLLASMMPSVYLPLNTVRALSPADGPPRVHRVLIDLRPDADAGIFGARWRTRLAAIDPVLKLKLTSETRSEMDKNLQGMQVMSYLGGTVAMLAATFIVLSALSMGVNEQQRVMAMMRAIGASRWQLGALVLSEGMLLGLGGVLVGVPLGIAFLEILSRLFADLFLAGAVVSWGGVAFASVGTLLATLVAGAIPGWGAMRTDPLTAMTPLATGGGLTWPLLCSIPGVALVLVDSAILFGPWQQWLADPNWLDAPRQVRSWQFFAHFGLGLPCLMLGFFLVSPLVVVLVDRLLAPACAALTGVPLALLRQQMSGGIWRAAGTVSALMVGLSILVVLQTQGRTVVGGWRIPDRFPDVFLTTYSIGGLKPQQQKQLAEVKGIRDGQLLPIAIASPDFGSTIFSIRGAAVMPDATMFFGVPPALALQMMQLDFRDGTPERAVALMTSARRHILVTEEFRQLRGLKTGDKLPLKTPKNGVQDYTIAGVVWSPGIDVIVSMFDLGRQFDQRTAASIFGTLEDARDDFGVDGVYLFAANLEPGLDKEQLVADIRKSVSMLNVQVGDVREVKHSIQTQFHRVLWLVSTVAFSAMAVASLGVANTIMASVRSRRWQFGILRSIGLTGGQLLRLIMAEAVLLGIAGAVIGVAAGMAMAVNAKQMLVVVAGYNPSLKVPYFVILIGVASVMAISILAGLWPAVSTARREPLALLQAGRSSS